MIVPGQKSRSVVAGIGIACMFALTALGAAPRNQGGSDDESKLVGDWSGNSICQVRESACHDEKVVYHLSEAAGKPGWVTISADKIVNGTPVNMGSSDYKYDSGKKTLTDESVRGIWKFSIAGERMEGTLTLPDGRLFRRVSLSKTK
ncbi:MAG TPA: hypothetical protein VGZ48_03995 [Candidatus Acidoferrales bacterium]|jgi:hypothetical protein|nr:hypothetical protein [Candidatus Acidoferrales bacterium]